MAQLAETYQISRDGSTALKQRFGDDGSRRIAKKKFSGILSA